MCLLRLLFICLCLSMVTPGFADNTSALHSQLQNYYNTLTIIEQDLTNTNPYYQHDFNQKKRQLLDYQQRLQQLKKQLDHDLSQNQLQLILANLNPNLNAVHLKKDIQQRKKTLNDITTLEKYLQNITLSLKKKQHSLLYDRLLDTVTPIYALSPQTVIIQSQQSAKMVLQVIASYAQQMSQTFMPQKNKLLLGALLILSYLFLSTLNKRLWRHYGPNLDLKKPTFFDKSRFAILVLTTSGLIPLILLCLWILAMIDINMITLTDNSLSLLIILGIMIITWAYFKACLAKHHPTYRLLLMNNHHAAQTDTRLKILLAITFVLLFLDHHINAHPYPETIIYLAKLILYTTLSACAFLLIRTKARLVTLKEEQQFFKPLLHALKIMILVATLAIPLLMFFGYVWLASLMIYAIIETSFYLGIAFIAHYLFHYFILPHLATTRKKKNVHTKAIHGIKTDVTLYWSRIIFMAVFLMVSLAMLSIIWHLFSIQDVFMTLKSLFFGFPIGNWHFSLARFLIALTAFILIYKLTRWSQNYLTDTIFPLITLQKGLYNAIASSVGYLGIVVAIYVALWILGISLAGLAYVLGGLSIGIGLGLKPVIVNFISGILLLLERHIRRGDFLTVDGQEGTVKKISFRSTELITHDKNTLIVPNSQFITELVQNWSYQTRRLKIDVGVGCDSNVELVKKTLLAIGQTSTYALDEPKPYVRFLSYGDYTLDFQLRVYVKNPEHCTRARSEINFLINDAFAKAGIDIPYPRQEVQLLEEKKTKLKKKK